MSELLVGKILTVRPALAVKIGLNEAILLQQLDYWLNHAEKEHDGRMWIYKSYEKWQEQDFPFWSVSTVKRIVKRLREINLIDTESLSDNFNNRVNYYTINRKELEKLNTPLGQIDTMGLGQSDTAPSYQVDTTPLGQSDTFSKEINKEINQESKHSHEIDGDVLAARDSNAESILNWQPPTRESIQSQLFLAGTPFEMTDAQYNFHVENFKAYFEQQAADGKPLKLERIRATKLRSWIQSEAKRNPVEKTQTAARPHSNRSDAFSQTNEPRLTRQQQLEKNKQAMIEAGLQA